MPSFTVPIARLTEQGPVFEVALSPSAFMTEKILEEQGQVYSEYVRAMVDTGASSSVIADNLPFLSQLTSVGAVKVTTPASTEIACPAYVVAITFTNEVVAKEVEVVAVPYMRGDVKCLIGRDVLHTAVFIYNGQAESVTLSF